MKTRPALLLSLCLFVLPAVAQEEIRVGVELQPYQPYSDVQGGEYRGYARDLLDAFAAESGYRFVYTPLPVRRLLSDFLAGRVDLKFPDHPQWNADQKAGHAVRYSQPAAPYVDGILVKPQHLGQGMQRIELLGTQIGVELQPYQPYSDVQGGEYRGYARDLLDAFAAESGYRFVYTPLPVRRLLSDFLAGRVDLKFPDHPQWNADQKAGHAVRYSQPAAPYVDGILVKPQHLGQGMQRIELLGTQNGFTPWPYLSEIRGGRIRLIQANQIESLLRMASSDRVDAVYLNPRVVAYQLKQMDMAAESLVFDPTLPHVEDHYYLSSIHHPQLIEAFDRFLEQRADQVAALRLRHGL